MTSQNPTILHVIDTTGPGGAETVFLDIAEKMRLADYETLALIKGPGWVQSQLEAREIPFHVLKPYGFLSIPYYRDLIRLIRDKRVRLIQAHLLGSALTSSIIRFFTGIPVIATLHGQVDVNSKERFIALKRLILKFGLSKVVAVSGELADYLADRKLFTRSKIEVIHNGVDINKYGAAARLPLKEQLGLILSGYELLYLRVVIGVIGLAILICRRFLHCNTGSNGG
ncbi:MAG: glycosyltransferase [Reinekea sp.]